MDKKRTLSMSSYFADLQKVVIRLEKISLIRNKLVTSLTFSLLMISVFFIQIHPQSVWYYFIAGIFTSKIIGLIFEKTNIKNRINEHTNRLFKIGQIL